MKIRPLHDRVVVRRKEQQEMTAGGIVLPGSAKEKPNEGEIIAVGSGRILDNGNSHAMSVKVGDQILFGRYAGNDTITLDDEELIILKESDIFGIIES